MNVLRPVASKKDSTHVRMTLFHIINAYLAGLTLREISFRFLLEGLGGSKE